MKTNDALEKVVGTSHRRIARVDLYGSGGLIQADIPVTAGTVRGRSNLADRWSADITLSGTEWVPKVPTDPLSGFAQTWFSVHLGAEVDTVDETVEVCRVIPVETRVRRSVDDVEVTVECVGLAGYLGLGPQTRYAAQRDETCQQMILRIVQDAAPPGWSGTVVDDTTPVAIPVGFFVDDKSAVDVIRDLVSIANITVYFDAMGTLILRNPLGVYTSTARTVAVAQDLSTLDAEMGRLGNFANRVELTFAPAGASNRQRVSSDWTYKSQSGKPNAGEVRRTIQDDGEQWRIHVRDESGKRRGRGLRSIATGDIIEALSSSGGRTVGEVVGTSDQGSYIQVDVDILETEDGGVQNNESVELAAFVALDEDIVGTAEWTEPPLGVSSGAVTYTESLTGNVSQAQANARAQALLESLIRAWQTYVVEAIPDPRLEPDDDIELVTLDGVTYCRITQIDLPLAADSLMRLGVRTFPKGPPLYPAADLQPAFDLYPLGA